MAQISPIIAIKVIMKVGHCCSAFFSLSVNCQFWTFPILHLSNLEHSQSDNAGFMGKRKAADRTFMF